MLRRPPASPRGGDTTDKQVHAVLLESLMKPMTSSRKATFAGTLSVIALSGIAFAVASGQSESIAAPAPRTSTETTIAAGRAKIDSDQYLIEMKPSASYKAGQEGSVEIAITAKGDYKINEKYPIKFKAAEPADGSVKFAKAVLKREDGSFETKKGSLKVPFTAARSGKATVSGVLSISVCTAETCLMDKVELETTVDVQ